MHRRSDPQLCYIVDNVSTRLLISFLLFGLFRIFLSFVYFDKCSGGDVGEILCITKRKLTIEIQIKNCRALNVPSICHIVFAVPIALFKSLLNVCM